MKATVVSAAADGAVVISAFGGRIDAFSGLALEVGKAYEFTVTSTSPKIVLAAARALVLPSLASASGGGQLGPPPAELSDFLGGFFKRVMPGQGEDIGASDLLRESLARIVSGEGKGEDLKSLHAALGHDQEARVAQLGRVSPEDQKGEVQALKQTVKAAALEMIAGAESGGTTDRALKSATNLVEHLHQVESENAHRADHGGALLLPLPISADAGMRDARMFLLHKDSADEGADGNLSGEEAFTIVLLLDLTKLGAVRVDVRVRGEEVTAGFQLVDYDAAAKLRQALPDLELGLAASSLSVENLAVRHVPRGELPVADLVVPPKEGGAHALVDLHV